MTFEEFKALLVKQMDEDKSLTDDQKTQMINAVDQVKPLIDAIDKQTKKLQLNDAERHALAYITGHNKPTKGMSASDYAALQYTAASFVHEHKQEITELTDGTDTQSGQEVRLSFIVWLMEYDGLSSYATTADAGDAGIKVDLLPGLYQKSDPTIDDILDVVGFGNAALLYRAYKNDSPVVEHETYRTREKAQKESPLTSVPGAYAVPTTSAFQYAMSLYDGSKAYLQPITVEVNNLTFKKGHMYFAGSAEEISDVELQNIKTKEGIQSLDLPKLGIFYSIILKDALDAKRIKETYSIYLPDLAEKLGVSSSLSKTERNAILGIAQSFHTIVGIVHGTRNGKPSNSFYMVLNFESYNEKTDVLTFSSPYLNYVIREAYHLSIRKKKDGTPKLKKNGEPLRLPTDSYMIDMSIANERNKAAVENVKIIVQLIEQAGDNIPRIKASTIVERNPILAEQLENNQNKRRTLQRVFSKTWELLRTKTRLTERYKNIQLPDPDDPATIPNKSTFDSMVFSFPHEGKIKD